MNVNELDEVRIERIQKFIWEVAMPLSIILVIGASMIILVVK